MPKRTTPPLTNAERCRRYRVNHPEKKEEFRLHMKAVRAANRQKQLAERLGVITPTQDEDDQAYLAAIQRIKDINKIKTGLTQDDIPNVDSMVINETSREGSKV